MILHHRILGQGGTPLIILHGLFGGSDNWQTLGKRFAEYRQVILVDQRNHGRSFHDNAMDYPSMAQDLLTLMDHLDVDRAHLLGHSMGGKTVMRFAMSNPNRCESILVADIGPGQNSDHHVQIRKAFSAPDLDSLSTRKEVESAMRPFIENEGVLMFLMKNLYWKEKGQLAWRVNLPVIFQNFQEILAGVGDDSVMAPGLFVRGTASDYIVDDDWPEIERQFPLCELESIEEAGHWLHAEKPDDFFEIVQDYLGE